MRINFLTRASIFSAAVLLTSGLLALDEEVISDECPTPVECIQKIEDMIDRSRTPGTYPSKAMQSVIKKLHDFGEEAMPLIMKLLEHDDELIARVGGVALRDAKSIDPKYLPQIVKGMDKDVSWLAPALGKIKTDEAAELAVKYYLVSQSAPHNQEVAAVRMHGKRAIPAMVRAAKCELDCPKDRYYLLGYVAGEFKEDRDIAATAFMRAAEDSSLSLDVRRGILTMIQPLGEAGLIVEHRLLKLKQDIPSLSESVSNALIGIKSEHAGKILMDRLANSGDARLFREIARLGPKGRDAGVLVTEFLDAPAYQVRRMAANTLGRIGYQEAVPRMIPLLNDRSDVKLNLFVARALGRMNAEIAKPELLSTAENHWFPPVREEARKALDLIEIGAVKEKRETNRRLIDFEDFDVEVCEETELAMRREPKEQKLYRSESEKALEKIAYQAEIISYGANDEDQQMADNPGGIIEVNQSNMVERRQLVKQIPDIALRVTGGYLVGANRGEWGGDLAFVPDEGEIVRIRNDNIEDIYKLGDVIIAVTGLAHLSYNEGMIYKLTKDQYGSWTTDVWRALPGAPRSSWFVETGEVLINTSGGGTVLVSENGEMRMAPCKN